MYLTKEEKLELLGCGEFKRLTYTDYKSGNLRWTMDYYCLKLKKFLNISDKYYKIGKRCKYKKEN